MTLKLMITLMLTVAGAAAPASVVADQIEIGRSVEDRRIFAETFGDGPLDVIIVGGIHGGAPVDEFDFRSVNTRPGRFNANGVDLNRNWDATWRPTSTWGSVVVDAGNEPFSEPETRTVRDYFLQVDPVASVFYQSAGGFLWYSGAEEGWQESLRLAEVYGQASGYRVARPPVRDPEEREDDDITGSSDDWFYRIGHRNVTVELTTHYVIEWERNLAGFEALLEALP